MEENDDSVSIDFETLQLFVNYLEAVQAMERAQAMKAALNMKAVDVIEESEVMEESEGTEESEDMEEHECRDNVTIDKKFEPAKCYRNIFGTETSFRLVVDSSSVKDIFEATLYPEDEETSPALFVRCHINRATLKMSIGDEYQPEFVTFASCGDNVTVFSPDVAQPIGRVVRYKAAKIINDKSEIVCYATNMKFTMENFDSNANSPEVPSMQILDSNKTVLAAGCVRKVTITRSNCSVSRNFHEFVMLFDDRISEPTKVMFLVAFTNWARWSHGEANGRGKQRSFIYGLRFFVIFWLIILFLYMLR